MAAHAWAACGTTSVHEGRDDVGRWTDDDALVAHDAMFPPDGECQSRFQHLVVDSKRLVSIFMFFLLLQFVFPSLPVARVMKSYDWILTTA